MQITNSSSYCSSKGPDFNYMSATKELIGRGREYDMAWICLGLHDQHAGVRKAVRCCLVIFFSWLTCSLMLETMY
jgi:hypothetical protein